MTACLDAEVKKLFVTQFSNRKKDYKDLTSGLSYQSMMQSKRGTSITRSRRRIHCSSFSWVSIQLGPYARASSQFDSEDGNGKDSGTSDDADDNDDGGTSDDAGVGGCTSDVADDDDGGGTSDDADVGGGTSDDDADDDDDDGTSNDVDDVGLSEDTVDSKGAWDSGGVCKRKEYCSGVFHSGDADRTDCTGDVELG